MPANSDYVPAQPRLMHPYTKMSRDRFTNHVNREQQEGRMTLSQATRLSELYDQYWDEIHYNRRKTGRVKAGWRELLKRMAIEIRDAKTSRNYFEKRATGPHAPAAVEAYNALIEVLTATLHLMQQGRDLNHTPKQWAEFLREHQGVVIPHNGDQWTDWVPPKKRKRVMQMFEAIDYPPKAKRKIAFPRKADDFKPEPTESR